MSRRLAIPGVARPWNTAWGVVKKVTDTSPQTSIGAEADFSHPGGLTWTPTPGRLYYVSIETGYVGISSPPGYAFLYICDASNTHLQTFQATCRAGTNDDAGIWSGGYYESFTTGASVTRKIRGSCTSGTYSLVASAQQPILFVATVVGPA